MKLTKSKIALLLLSIAGFFDSSYLTILHYQNVIPPCNVALGCETVLTSQFSEIYGVPIALFGSIFFLTLIFLLLLSKNQTLFIFFRFMVLAGLLVSVVLFAIQAFILKAFCQYCILSEIIILGIFIVSFVFKEKSA